MEDLHHALFLLRNAPAYPRALMRAIAKFFAAYVIWVIPTIVGIG